MTVTHWDFARSAWEPGTLTLHMNVNTDLHRYIS